MTDTLNTYYRQLTKWNGHNEQQHTALHYTEYTKQPITMNAKNK